MFFARKGENSYNQLSDFSYLIFIIKSSKQPRLMRFDEKNFEKLKFDPFDFDNVLLNNTNNPDENIFNNLTQIDSVFYDVEKQQQVKNNSVVKLSLTLTLCYS